MKAKIKATGKVVDVEPLFYSELSNTNPMIHRAELEFQPTLIDWEQRRYELAKAAMQGLLSTRAYSPTEEVLCKYSILSANEMVKQLKGGQG